MTRKLSILALSIVVLIPVIDHAQKSVYPAKPHSGWTKSVERDRMQDTLYTVYLLPSSDRTAMLELTCSSGRVSYLMVDAHKILDNSPVEVGLIRFDKEQAVKIGNGSNVSDTLKEWYIMDDSELIPKILQSSQVLIDLPVYRGTRSLWEFHPKGFNLKELQTVCGVSLSTSTGTLEVKPTQKAD